MRHGWRLLALWALILAAYSNSFQAGLVFDNASLISGDDRIQAASATNFRRIFTEPYWPNHLSTGLYRPLTTLTYLLNYAVLGDGQQPEGYHSVNLALHAANTALVYSLGLAVFGAALPAWALAALWGLHPLLTESVTNIVGRADLLAALGVLAGLFCYARGVAAAGNRKLAWLGVMLAAQTVGLFSKENAAVLPALMLVFDLLGPRPLPWRARLPFYAALLPPFAAFSFMRSQLHAPLVVGVGENPLVGAGFWTARLTAVKVIGKWPWLFLWPAKLSSDYSYNAVPLVRWTDIQALTALLFCVASAAAVVRWGRARRPFAFFLAFFFVALAPTSNLVILIGSIMAERFAYLPAIGLAGSVVAAIQAMPNRRAAGAAAAVAALALGARTYARNFDWHDELSLWSSAVSACPESFKTHASLANALAGIPGRMPEAVAEYQAALRIKPDFAEGHLNLGNTFTQLPGRLNEAIAEYQEAVRLNRDSPEAHYSLGMALEQMPDRMPEAIAELAAALRLKPDFAAAHGALGNALATIPGRMPEAIAEYQAALGLDPSLAEAHFNFGVALSQTPGRHAEAIPEYQAALRIRPDYWEAHYNLGRAFLETGKLPEAIVEYEAAFQAHPDPRLQQLVEQLRARSR